MFAQHKIKLYGIIFFLITASITHAQIKCKIEHYSTENGLSHNGVTSILKSSDGFMWFGTWDGINRFDGQNFVTYKSYAGDSSGLTNNRIDRITEDQSGFLWLRPYDLSIYRFDKKTTKLLPVTELLAKQKIGTVKFDKVIPTAAEKVWLTTADKGVFCVVNAAAAMPEIKWYSQSMAGDFNLPSDSIKFLYEDQQHSIWVGTQKGVCAFALNAAGNYKKLVINLPALPPQAFIAIAENKQQLWFGTNEGYIICYDKSSQQCTSKKIGNNKLNALCLSKKTNTLYATTSLREIIRVSLPDLQADTKAFPGEGEFHAMYEDKAGLVWIEPEKEGIVKFDPHVKAFKYFTQKKDAKLSYPVKLFGVFEDNEDRVWVSMVSGGFGYYNPAKDEVEYFFNEPGAANHRFSNVAGAKYFDPLGILWFTSSDRGLEKVIFQRKDLDPKKLVEVPEEKSENEIRGIYNDNKSRVWIATKSGALYIQDYNGKRIYDLFVNLPKDGIGLVYTILQDSKNRIWLGTKGKGLYLAEPVDSAATKYKLTRYQSNKSDRYSLSSDLVYTLLEDKQHRIWAGTFENGPNLAIESNNTVTFINENNDFKSYAGAAAERVRHMQLDPSGNLWLATTNGLLVADISGADYKNYKFNVYRKNPGDKTSLGNNDLQFIFKDSKNRMWVTSSGGGLNEAIIAPNEGLHFKVFTKKDGLPSDYIVSIVEDNFGDLWLGTENGLCKFNPGKVFFSYYDSYDGLTKTRFAEAAGIKLANGNLLFGTINGYIIFNPATIANNKINAAMALTNLQVNNKDVVAGAEGSPLQLDINNTNAITLKHNENIISIDFTMLDYRANDKQAYAYRLVGFDKDWNNVINIHKATYGNLPPGDYTFEVKSLSDDLYNSPSLKTLHIIILPPWWRTWWAYMIYAVFLIILIEIIRRVIFTMIKLRNKVAVEKKLTDLKIKFFTNISHELRTPLTLIINPIEEISKQQNLSVKSYEYLAVARKNTSRMVRFINQLLDFQKIQHKKMGLKIAAVEIVSFLKDITGYFTEAANERQIELLVQSNVDSLWAWIDRDKMDIVIYNLLSNAFKFSAKGKSIVIAVNHITGEEKFSISVIDKGIGVPADKLEDIFELYYEVDKPETDHLAGTGIGLALSKEIVQLHHGKITAKNNAEGGLAVTVTLHSDKAHFNAADITIVDSLHDIPHHIETVDVTDILPANGFAEKITVAPVNAPTILIVDDNTELRNFLAGQLQSFYKVITAENGKDGLEKAATLLPDLVLSDVMMPEMNGIEMLDKLKNNMQTSHIPVILLTARSSVESQVEALSYGADYYITKPFNANLIVVLIENLLKQRKKIFESILTGKKEPVSEIAIAPANEIVITAKDELFLKEIISIIKTEMANPDFNIDKVAESLLMSRTTFYRKLKSLTNLAPVEFIKELRLKRSKELLDTGETDMAAIAYEVGFSSAKYFSACFKEKYDVSPSEYAKAKKHL